MWVSQHVLRRALTGLVAAVPLATGPLSFAGPVPATSPGPPQHKAVRSTAPKLPGELRNYQTRSSILGTHTWYRQVRDGHPVVDGWYAVHRWHDGTTTIDDGRQDVHRVAAGPADVTASTAVARATRRAGVETLSASPIQMVLPGTGGAPAQVVWRVVTADGHGITATYVDASDGQVLRSDALAKGLEAETEERRELDGSVTGRGRVFDPNPVVALQREGLRDRNDQDDAIPRAAYRNVALPRLDASHSLVGQWVRIANSNRATSATDTYRYRRSNPRFEQVSTYYALDAAQAYLQHLGLTDANAESQRVHVDSRAADNSFYNPANDAISTGRGGVDDAEDPEVLWHEYGHAVQDDQIPDFGGGKQARAIGEGFGDYLSATMSQKESPDTAKTPWGCLMDWDSTSYTAAAPHCIRRVDLDLSYLDRSGDPYADSEIWSGALWQLNLDLGRGRATKIIVEAQFAYDQSIRMPAAARLTVRAARHLFPDDATVADQTHQVFESRDTSFRRADVQT